MRNKVQINSIEIGRKKSRNFYEMSFNNSNNEYCSERQGC